MLRQREALELERRRRREAAGGRWRLPKPGVPALLARRNIAPLVITLHFTIVRVFCGYVTGVRRRAVRALNCGAARSVRHAQAQKRFSGTGCSPPSSTGQPRVWLRAHLHGPSDTQQRRCRLRGMTKYLYTPSTLGALVMFLTSAILSGAGASATLALVGQTLVGERSGGRLGRAAHGISRPIICTKA